MGCCRRPRRCGCRRPRPCGCHVYKPACTDHTYYKHYYHHEHIDVHKSACMPSHPVVVEESLDLYKSNANMYAGHMYDSYY